MRRANPLNLVATHGGRIAERLRDADFGRRCFVFADPADNPFDDGGRREADGTMRASPRGETMSFMLLIMEPPGQRDERGLDAGQAVYAQMQRFAEDLTRRGVLRAVESLASDKNAARVQVRDGRQRLVDGPFAEAKEMVGGFFVLDCATRDEAVAIAAECPAAAWCTIEVRELGPCWA